MKHLIVCREYAPAPGGGIGTYVNLISRLLAENGEVVHVIGLQCKQAEKELEEKCCGRLIIHRVPSYAWESSNNKSRDPLRPIEINCLVESNFPPQCFSWQASILAEQIVEQEGIDVIEAQEFEAPLYYFQLRRCLGMGPKRQPPCLVHLHTPTELVAQYNDWNLSSPHVMTAIRLENHSISTADALLCPSRFLAQQAEALYGLPAGVIRVIPYPIGDVTRIEREEEKWRHGSVCYIGRLERRKGILEWIDAAVAVAHKYPEAHFEFVGENILHTGPITGAEILRRRIPGKMRDRFNFRGQVEHSTLPQILADARMAVIPSRWENFPFSCIEAMGSGLPIIASRNGGMAEMIEDNLSGWLAYKDGREGLIEVLERALETPWKKFAEMGNRAAMDIRRLCDNKQIIENRLTFLNQIIKKGATNSLRLPANLSGPNKQSYNELKQPSPRKSSREGIAIVVTCFNQGQSLKFCLKSIERQTRKPSATIIIDYGSTDDDTTNALSQAEIKGWKVIRIGNGGVVAAKNAGVEAALKSNTSPLGFVFLDSEDMLLPRYIEVCESILKRYPEVGLISCWAVISEFYDKFWIRPCPCFPYQWISNDAVPFSTIRTDALKEVGNFSPVMSQGYDDWDLFNSVMAAGWIAVTVPEILGEYLNLENLIPHLASAYSYGTMRREILKRFSKLIARDSENIVLLTETYTGQLLKNEDFSLIDKRSFSKKKDDNPLISAIICTRNRADYLSLAIKSLLEQSISHDKYEIIIVDNCSTDSTKQLVESFVSKSAVEIRYFYEPKVGLSNARNTGWQNARGTYVAYLDDDAIASQHWLERILEAFSSLRPRPGCVGGKSEPIWEAPPPNWLSEKLLYFLSLADWSETPRFLHDLTKEWLVGANIAFPVKVLEYTGGFNSSLGRTGNKLLSNEEIFLLKRILESGYSCYYNPEIVIQHHIMISRLKKTWFIRRCFWQGVSEAHMQVLHEGLSKTQRIRHAIKTAIALFKSPQTVINLLVPNEDPERFMEKCLTFTTVGYLGGLFIKIKK